MQNQTKSKNLQSNETGTIESIYQPSQALLDNWSIWMSYEVVQQWQKSSATWLTNFDPKKVLNVDNEVISDSYRKLSLKIQEQKESKSTVDEIELAERELKLYSSVEVNNVQKVFQDLRSKETEKIHNLASVHSQKVNPQELLGLLANLHHYLKEKKVGLESEKDRYMEREESAWQAYCKLIHILKLSPHNSLDYKSKLEVVWNAISVYFEAKLKAQLYSAYINVLHNLMQQIQTQYNIAKRSAKILSEIETSLKEKSKLEIISIPVFSNLEKIDSEKHRRKLEIWIGHSINYWGQAPVTWQQVETKLLSNIEPVALEVCRDFQKSFLEHTFKNNLFVLGN